MSRESVVPGKSKCWFPAKTYGWDWGLPTVWQEWLDFAVASVLSAAAVFIVPAVAHPFYSQGYTVVILLLLVAVSWLKGEPPRWRFGG
jgi:hypothetical protein